MTIEYSLDALDDVANRVIKATNYKTLLFYGAMGTGKTTLIKALVKALGSDDDVSSPTYSLVNEYEGNNETLYHFDLYRLKNEEEAYDFGFEDYLQTSGWLFIEWPELILDLLPDNYHRIEIEIIDTNKRILTLK